MTSTRTLRRAAVVSAVVAALSVGVVAAPAGAASKADEKTAKTGVIVAKDLPAKWDSAPADPDSSEEVEALAAQFPECTEYLDSRQQLKRGANAESRQFTSPDDEDLSNEAWVFTTTAGARRAFRAMGASSNADCLTVTFQEALEQQIAADPTSAAQVASVSAEIQSTSSVPDAGDDQLGYIGAATFVLKDGTTQQLLLAYFAIRTGRGIVGYTIAAPPVDDGFSDGYAEAVEDAVYASAGRLEKALK